MFTELQLQQLQHKMAVPVPVRYLLQGFIPFDHSRVAEPNLSKAGSTRIHIMGDLLDSDTGGKKHNASKNLFPTAELIKLNRFHQHFCFVSIFFL